MAEVKKEIRFANDFEIQRISKAMFDHAEQEEPHSNGSYITFKDWLLSNATFIRVDFHVKLEGSFNWEHSKTKYLVHTSDGVDFVTVLEDLPTVCGAAALN